MSIGDDVEDLKDQIRKSISSIDKQQIARLMQQAFTLCETLKGELQGANPERKKELSLIMGDFREFLASESSKLSKMAGLTEDQFVKYNENPENFTQEQWIALQNVRKKFSDKTKEIRQIIKKKEPVSEKEEEVPLTGHRIVRSSLTPPKKKKVVLKKVKKSKWIRS